VSSSRHATTNGRPRLAISGSSCLTRFYGINTRVWYNGSLSSTADKPSAWQRAVEDDWLRVDLSALALCTIATPAARYRLIVPIRQTTDNEASSKDRQDMAVAAPVSTISTAYGPSLMPRVNSEYRDAWGPGAIELNSTTAPATAPKTQLRLTVFQPTGESPSAPEQPHGITLPRRIVTIIPDVNSAMRARLRTPANMSRVASQHIPVAVSRTGIRRGKLADASKCLSLLGNDQVALDSATLACCHLQFFPQSKYFPGTRKVIGTRPKCLNVPRTPIHVATHEGLRSICTVPPVLQSRRKIEHAVLLSTGEHRHHYPVDGLLTHRARNDAPRSPDYSRHPDVSRLVNRDRFNKPGATCSELRQNHCRAAVKWLPPHFVDHPQGCRSIRTVVEGFGQDTCPRYDHSHRRGSLDSTTGPARRASHNNRGIRKNDNPHPLPLDKGGLRWGYNSAKPHG